MRYSKRTLVKGAVALLQTRSVSDVMQALAKEMVRQRMHREVAGLIFELSRELYTAQGTLLAEVTSARTLSTKTKKYIQSFLKKKFQANMVSISYRINKDIIGRINIVTPLGGLYISVARQLDQLIEYV